MRHLHPTACTPLGRGAPAVLAKSSPRRQRGYLFEIPILLMLVIIVASIILPKLPPLGQKIGIVLAAIPVLFALFYMIVIPGWMPTDTTRLKPPWNWLVFILIAIPIVAMVALFVIA